MRYFLDCEFDGHNGPLLSMALVHESGDSIHIQTDVYPEDRWVQQNVMPIMGCHDAKTNVIDVTRNEVGLVIKNWLGAASMFEVIADSPVDIMRFCRAISTSPSGEWESTPYVEMDFKVHNVDCYPTDLDGAIQHNAYWDAMALQRKLQNEGII